LRRLSIPRRRVAVDRSSIPIWLIWLGDLDEVDVLIDRTDRIAPVSGGEAIVR
jgi:hypothetical protein